MVIIGCGPVGAVAACLLGQRGLSTLIIDRSHTIYDKPRAVALDHEIARILQNIGLGEAIKPHIEPFTASEYFGVDGQLIKRLDMLPRPYPMGWTPSMVFMQPALEALLRRRLADLPSVKSEFGVELIGLNATPDSVTARLSDASARTRDVRCRYLIGCDGASSSVRSYAGIGLDDLGFDQPWLVVDVLANERGLARLPAVSTQYCEPARPTTYVVCTGLHRRWEFQLLPGEDPRAMTTPDRVWSLLQRWIAPSEGELWRSASYRFHALVANGWRRGRVFVAGDAAHQQPPFLGQGFCQGVRDVANLAWKLDRLVNAKSEDGLLDTYGTERTGHVRRLHAVIKGIGEIVGERDVARARARDARLVAETGGTVRSVPRQNLQPALEAGCLGTRPGSARGTLFPQPVVQHGSGSVLLDDLTGAVGRCVLDRTFPTVSAALRRRLAALDLIVVRLIGEANGGAPEGDNDLAVREADQVLATWFRTHECAAAIVRPDHYVFATVRDEADLAVVLDDYMRAVAVLPLASTHPVSGKG